MSMKKSIPLLLSLVTISTLTSCSNGFSYEYGYGAVLIQISDMKLSTKTNFQFEDETVISFGHYLTYQIDYTNIAYYWQELPHHHYYFDGIMSKRTSPYLNGRVSITCSAETIEREVPVHCAYVVLLSIINNYSLEGDVNIFVTNQKLERLIYIAVTIKNNRILLRNLED